ncbi:uncharacterized protein LOC123290764 [Chrysoperla carnea]|uniref:uncharacterized protein LOC123290764 n=1 Tax=Chrysoperla carnea TaxID=189513 RepID=UPI001D0757AC|nr:uncharacterized protein LOC123290764 [Chrysoperla carnea]
MLDDENNQAESNNTSANLPQHNETEPNQYPHAIRLQLYYDELEIVNPLGSKTGVHKLGAFYYIVQNLPPHMNSELNSIHVLLLCSDADVKKYGFTQILEPFLYELKKLESDEGIPIETEQGIFVLRASIAAFCGDGLAVHDVFNLLGPSANRMCMYSRDDLHAGSLNSGQERDENLFQEHVNLLRRTNYSPESKSNTGVRNKIFDPMHDLLCGICPMILKLVLKQYVIVQRLFSVNYFNDKISAFQWGYCEMVNKPSANFTNVMLRKKEHTLSQKAMQIWCLIRAFPFLVSGKIADDDEYLELIRNLLQIMEIVFALKLMSSQMPYLDALIRQFRMKFRRLFPEVDQINITQNLFYGLVLYWCMRFEAKHRNIKLRAQCVCSYKNPSKTLVRVSQCGQSAKWGSKDVKIIRCSSRSGENIQVQNSLSREFLLALNYTCTDNVFRSKSVKFNGVEFRPNLYTCLEVAHVRDDNLPVFGKIKEIIMLNNNEVHLLMSIFEGITGEAFLELQKLDLQTMKIKIGPQLIIMKLINNILEKTSPVNENAIIIQQPTLATSPISQSINQHVITPNNFRFTEHYFDDKTKTGFIEFRLFTMRKSLDASKKK